jgi:hypothetical protein
MAQKRREDPQFHYYYELMLLKGDQRNQFGGMIFIARMEWTNDANVLSAGVIVIRIIGFTVY